MNLNEYNSLGNELKDSFCHKLQSNNYSLSNLQLKFPHE